MPYCVAATFGFGQRIGHDVKSATVRSGRDVSRVESCRQPMEISSADGCLEVILEGRHRAIARRKSRVEMAQAVRIRTSVDFDRRIAHQIEPSPEKMSGAVPFGKPAVGASQRKRGQGCMPCPMTRGRGRTGSDEGDKLGGSQRCVGQDVVPVDRKRPAAAYVRMAVRAKKRSPRVTISLPDSARPRR